MLRIKQLEIQSLGVGVARGRGTLGSFLLDAPDLLRVVPFEVGSDMQCGSDGAFFIGGVRCVKRVLM